MSVGSMCNHNVATIGPDTDIVEAAKRMREAHVGDLIVVEQRDGHTVPAGIITDRDIVIGVIAKEAPADDIIVRDLMSLDLLTVREQSGVTAALRDMGRKGVRRAPVVGAHDELVGVLSIDDVIGHLAEQFGHIARLLDVEQFQETRTRP